MVAVFVVAVVVVVAFTLPLLRLLLLPPLPPGSRRVSFDIHAHAPSSAHFRPRSLISFFLPSLIAAYLITLFCFSFSYDVLFLPPDSSRAWVMFVAGYFFRMIDDGFSRRSESWESR